MRFAIKVVVVVVVVAVAVVAVVVARFEVIAQWLTYNWPTGNLFGGPLIFLCVSINSFLCSIYIYLYICI